MSLPSDVDELVRSVMRGVSLNIPGTPGKTAKVYHLAQFLQANRGQE